MSDNPSMARGWFDHACAGHNWIDTHRHAYRGAPGTPHPGMNYGSKAVADAAHVAKALDELEALKRSIAQTARREP